MGIFINWKKYIDERLEGFEPGSGSGGVDIPKYETVSELPSEAELGDLAVILSLGEIYVYIENGWATTGLESDTEVITTLRDSENLPDPSEATLGDKYIKDNSIYERVDKELEAIGDGYSVLPKMETVNDFDEELRLGGALKGYESNNADDPFLEVYLPVDAIIREKNGRFMDGEYLTLEFAQEVEFDRIEVEKWSNVNQQLGKFRIETSDNGEDWELLHHWGDRVDSVTLTERVSCKFIKMTKESGSNGSTYFVSNIFFVKDTDEGTYPTWEKVLIGSEEQLTIGDVREVLITGSRSTKNNEVYSAWFTNVNFIEKSKANMNYAKKDHQHDEYAKETHSHDEITSIQQQVDAIGNGMTFKEEVPTFEDIPSDKEKGDTFVVSNDETHDDQRSLYTFNGEEMVYLGTFGVSAGAVINDNKASSTSVYSSQKVENELSNKLTEEEGDARYAKEGHTHDLDFASKDHDHDTEYAKLGHSHADLEGRMDVLEEKTEGDNADGITKGEADTRYAKLGHSHVDIEGRLTDLEDRPIGGGGEGDITEEEADKKYASIDHSHEDLEVRLTEIEGLEIINDEEEADNTTYSSEKIEERIADGKVDTSKFESKIQVIDGDVDLPDPEEFNEGDKIIRGNVMYERWTAVEGEGEVGPLFEVAEHADDVPNIDLIKDFETSTKLEIRKDHRLLNMFATKPTYTDLEYRTNFQGEVTSDDYLVIEFKSEVVISEFMYLARGNYILSEVLFERSSDGEDWELIHHQKDKLSRTDVVSFPDTKDLINQGETIKFDREYGIKFLRIRRNPNMNSGRHSDNQVELLVPFGPIGEVVTTWVKVLDEGWRATDILEHKITNHNESATKPNLDDFSFGDKIIHNNKLFEAQKVYEEAMEKFDTESLANEAGYHFTVHKSNDDRNNFTMFSKTISNSRTSIVADETDPGYAMVEFPDERPVSSITFLTINSYFPSQFLVEYSSDGEMFKRALGVEDNPNVDEYPGSNIDWRVRYDFEKNVLCKFIRVSFLSYGSGNKNGNVVLKDIEFLSSNKVWSPLSESVVNTNEDNLNPGDYDPANIIINKGKLKYVDHSVTDETFPENPGQWPSNDWKSSGFDYAWDNFDDYYTIDNIIGSYSSTSISTNRINEEGKAWVELIPEGTIFTDKVKFGFPNSRLMPLNYKVEFYEGLNWIEATEAEDSTEALKYFETEHILPVEKIRLSIFGSTESVVKVNNFGYFVSKGRINTIKNNIIEVEDVSDIQGILDDKSTGDSNLFYAKGENKLFYVDEDGVVNEVNSGPSQSEFDDLKARLEVLENK